MTEWSGITKDVWALPPRGVTHTSVKHRAGEVHQWTYLCENNGCFALAYSQESADQAKSQVAGHICPETNPRRGLIPTGKTLIQKMWDEADDAMDAFKAGGEYKGYGSDALKGYIAGVAEILTFCTVPCFSVVEDVLRQLNKRWKMRNGDLPFSPTPSYNYQPHLDANRSNAMTREVTAKPSVRQPATRVTRKEVTKVPVDSGPIEVALSVDQRKSIRDAFHSGTMTEQQLAEIFGITPERVVTIAGKKPTGAAPTPIISGLF